MFSDALITQAEELLALCRKHKVVLTAAESCTGGLLSALLTEIAGASQVFERGFVTYSNAAKTQMLGVGEMLLKKYGAVSLEAAVAMAEGALEASGADISFSITGIAGPDGGTQAKPVGLVYIAIGSRKTGRTVVREYRFSGNRNAIRLKTVQTALDMLQNDFADYVSLGSD